MGSHIKRPRRAPAALRPRGAAASEIQVILDGIRFLVHRLRESSREAERRIGLTGAQLFVLQRLRENDDLSINDLAARTYTHQSSVSVVVSRLVRRGLVRRRQTPGDARRWSLSLSEEGRRALTIAPEASQAAIIHALQRLPSGTRRAVAGAMRRVTGDMGAPREQAMFFEAHAGTRKR
jgi:DNA-binding MarR family transcriptional regulator